MFLRSSADPSPLCLFLPLAPFHPVYCLMFLDFQPKYGIMHPTIHGQGELHVPPAGSSFQKLINGPLSTFFSCRSMDCFCSCFSVRWTPYADRCLLKICKTNPIFCDINPKTKIWKKTNPIQTQFHSDGNQGSKLTFPSDSGSTALCTSKPFLVDICPLYAYYVRFDANIEFI